MKPMCGSLGWAGPSGCILDSGHEGGHQYGDTEKEEERRKQLNIQELEQQLAAKDDEIRELVTSDNKVIVDLSKYVETLEQKIAAKDARYRNLLRWFDRDDEPELGEYVYTAEIRSREDSIEKAIDKELRK